MLVTWLHKKRLWRSHRTQRLFFKVYSIRNEHKEHYPNLDTEKHNVFMFNVQHILVKRPEIMPNGQHKQIYPKYNNRITLLQRTLTVRIQLCALSWPKSIEIIAKINLEPFIVCFDFWQKSKPFELNFTMSTQYTMFQQCFIYAWIEESISFRKHWFLYFFGHFMDSLAI